MKGRGIKENKGGRDRRKGERNKGKRDESNKGKGERIKGGYG